MTFIIYQMNDLLKIGDSSFGSNSHFYKLGMARFGTVRWWFVISVHVCGKPLLISGVT
jgi:hypothetical protein